MWNPPMLAKKLDDNKHKLFSPTNGKCFRETFLQPKLDGVRMIWDGEQAWSRRGKKLAVPENVLHDLRTIFRQVCLDGELFSLDTPFDDISGQARRLVNQDVKVELEYHVFDVINTACFSTRSAHLAALFNEYDSYTSMQPSRQPSIFQVPTHLILDWEDVENHMEHYINLGYEGVMVRLGSGRYIGHRTHWLLKHKRFVEEPFHVCGFIEGRGKHRGRLGALQFATVGGEVGKVGTGFSDEQREQLWIKCVNKSILGMIVTVRFQEKTKKGKPRFPSFVSIRTNQ